LAVVVGEVLGDAVVGAGVGSVGLRLGLRLGLFDGLFEGLMEGAPDVPTSRVKVMAEPVDPMAAASVCSRTTSPAKNTTFHVTPKAAVSVLPVLIVSCPSFCSGVMPFSATLLGALRLAHSVEDVVGVAVPCHVTTYVPVVATVNVSPFTKDGA
jgi:hypothetical protein